MICQGECKVCGLLNAMKGGTLTSICKGTNMKPTLKPGTLCIVQGSNMATPGLLGRIVEVTGLAVSGDLFCAENEEKVVFRKDDETLTYSCTSSSTIPWKLLDNRVVQMKSRPIDGACLIPINDPDPNLEIETTEDIPEKITCN